MQHRRRLIFELSTREHVTPLRVRYSYTLATSALARPVQTLLHYALSSGANKED